MNVAGTLPEIHPGNAGSGNWLQPLREPWPVEAVRRLARHPALIRVLLVAKRGSAPCDVGACMLVTADEQVGTIGGGHLEWETVRMARAMLEQTHCAAAPVPAQLRRLILGRELAQCCGGEVQVWLERFSRNELPWLQRVASVSLSAVQQASCLMTRLCNGKVQRQLLRPGMPQWSEHCAGQMQAIIVDDDVTLIEPLGRSHMSLWLYGAGHVGQALVRVLADLPINTTWIDTRAELFPDTVPGNVRITPSAAPWKLVRSAPADAHHRILTHDHSLDYALCREVLAIEFASLGVIGSRSKAVRFRNQLQRDGVAAQRVAALQCPIGLAMPGKQPAALAIGIAAELLQSMQVATAASGTTAHVDELCQQQDCRRCHAGAAAS